MPHYEAFQYTTSYIKYNYVTTQTIGEVKYHQDFSLRPKSETKVLAELINLALSIR